MKRYRVNNQIRLPQVSLIDEEGKLIGIIDTPKALQLARERGLDLVEVAPNAQPPVCKLLNFGKFLYRMAKQERQHKAKQKKSEIKGLRFGIGTGQHDLEIKAKKAEKFLENGHQVKIEILLRGREKQHQDLARQKLENFVKMIVGEIKMVQGLKKFPSGFSIIVSKPH